MELNYLAILAGAAAFWVLGALWYSPVLFSKVWQKEVGLSDEQIKSGNMALTFGGSFVLMIFMSVGLYFIMASHPAELVTFAHGCFHGAMLGFLVGASAVWIGYLYQQKSLQLFAIDGLYMIVGLALSGGVMSLLM